MAWWGQGNLHSTLVALAKVLLPLMALAVLSTLFFVSNSASPEDTIPYAEGDALDMASTQALTGAVFAGMTEDGAAVTLKADEATPRTTGSDQPGAAKGLSGLIETPDGITTTITGAAATLDQQARVVTLSGGVTVQNSTGFDLQTDSMLVTLDRTRMESQGPVTAHAPFGEVKADKLLITRGADGLYKLDFTGGVRLLYHPATAGTASP